ncbi:MAG: acyl-CoA dehydrogenase [Gammaproteobacteria bacterium]|nr:acyl-CoA dehydrogenase [Gammaproteobacteria bacterium]
MHFELSEEQQMVVDSVRAFVEQEMMPHEEAVEQSGRLDPELRAQIRQKAIANGFYSAGMPEELGGGGLDQLTLALMNRELGRTSYAMQMQCGRPSNILQACVGAQREEYLLPAVRGDRVDCLALTEPDAGSDLRGMQCRAQRDGDDYVLNGTKHFISHADEADFAIVFAATGEVQTDDELVKRSGPRKKITAFLVDKGSPGFTVRDGYQSVSHRGYHNCILEFDHCRVPAGKILGEEHKGFDVANEWLASTRLEVAATCLGRADRALDIALNWAAERKQFGQSIGKYQGVSFKLADMKMRYEAAEMMTLRCAWKDDQGTASDSDYAMAKLMSSEMLAYVADEAIQILGGMGLMADFPLERIWRDARVERIWDGTSEIQRHIISRNMLRPLGA